MVVHFVSFFEQRDTHPNHSTLRAIPGWLHQAAAGLDNTMHTMLRPLYPKTESRLEKAEEPW